MNRLAFLRYFVIALLASGCATEAQRQAISINRAYQDATAKLGACEQEVVSSPEGVSAAEKYAIGNNDPDVFLKMSNLAFATDRDKEILFAFLVREAPCRSIAVQEFSKSHPAFGASMANYYAQQDRNAASLMRGEITIGAFHSTLVSAHQKLVRDFQANSAQISNNLLVSHQNELQQWAALASAVNSWNVQTNALAQQRRTVRTAQKPTQTHCEVIGQSVTCRTR